MFVSPFNVLAIALVGGVVGVLGAILGTGGGVFLIPVLVLGFDVPIHYAVATSIVSVIATSSAVASANVERGTANMPLGMTLEIATTIGAILGGLSAGWVSARVLETMFGLLLFPTATLMWLGRTEKGENGEPLSDQTALPETPADRAPLNDATSLGGSYYDEGEKQFVCYRVRRLGAGLGISCLAGGVSGLLGVGGGIFKVPALHLLCDVPIKAAAATSNFMIGVTGVASALIYYGRGDFSPLIAAATALGVFAGSRAGAALAGRLDPTHTRRAFAVVMVLIAIQMILKAAGWWFA
jgi:hypothetical protein